MKITANLIVDIHCSVDFEHKRLARLGRKSSYMTPRDFLDFIEHITMIYEQKSTESEGIRLHLESGCNKLKDTKEEVAQLQKELAIKSAELEEKNVLAEAKMKEMLSGQTEAEKSKDIALKLTEDLALKEVEIADKSAKVAKELESVTPILEKAKNAVSNIEPKQVKEVSVLNNPPGAVRLCIETVVILLLNAGKKSLTWQDCQKEMKRDFLNRVLRYSDIISGETKDRLLAIFDTEAWDLDRITRASTAAGPLAAWAQSMIQYQTISMKVAPLKAQVELLEKEAQQNKEDLEKNQKIAEDMTLKVNKFKKEYGVLIGEVEKIKIGMAETEEKVNRCVDLLKNLGAEETRWAASVVEIHKNSDTIFGDCMLTAAICTYSGFFAFSERRRLLDVWLPLLSGTPLYFNTEILFTEFLSSPNDRFEWENQGLSTDELCMENAVIFKQKNRYPLVIDPTGSCSEWMIANLEANKKRVVETSYNDPKFIKQLESALRFGTTVMIKDVDRLNPLLNGVLNKETYRSGGRVMISVGDLEVDYNPEFDLILLTRDTTAKFPPDLASRVTFINFTVTTGSLKAQILKSIMISERPDMHEKMQNLIKQQGEFDYNIRIMERELLDLLNKTKNILEGTTVLTALEDIQRQTNQMKEDKKKNVSILEDLTTITLSYEPFARTLSRLYFTMQNMNEIDQFYQYDLSTFQRLVDLTLSESKSVNDVDKTDFNARLEIIEDSFYDSLFRYIAIGMQQTHKMALCSIFFRVVTEGRLDRTLDSIEWHYLMMGESSLTETPPIERVGFWQTKLKSLALIETPSDSLADNIAQILHNIPHISEIQLFKDDKLLTEFMNAVTPEDNISESELLKIIQTPLELMKKSYGNIEDATTEFGENTIKTIYKCILIKCLRPDRLPHIIKLMMSSLFFKPQLRDENLPSIQASGLSIEDMLFYIESVIQPTQPFILMTSPGEDASGIIIKAAEIKNKRITPLSMGSQESFQSAITALERSISLGEWLLLKNVHLCSKWLSEVEKKIFSTSSVHSEFRLFLVMEKNSRTPDNILRLSTKTQYEPPSGIRGLMMKCLNDQIPQKIRIKPKLKAIRFRLIMALSCLHSIILERRRYQPIGWTKAYEFSDVDFISSVKIIDEWIIMASGDSTILDISAIPWSALRTIICDVIYNGRLDNTIDKVVVRSFVEDIFDIKNLFGRAFKIAGNSTNPWMAPEFDLTLTDEGSSALDIYRDWAKKLPVLDDPRWIGLASNADKIMAARDAISSLVTSHTVIGKTADEVVNLTSPTRLFSKDVSSRHMLQTYNSITDRLNQGTSKGVASFEGIVHGWPGNMALKMNELIRMLPQALPIIPKITSKMIEDPMLRFALREFEMQTSIIDTIKEDLSLVMDVVENRTKFTNRIRKMAHEIQEDFVPSVWLPMEDFKRKSLTLKGFLLDKKMQVYQISCIISGVIPSCVNKDGNPYELIHDVETKKDFQNTRFLGNKMDPSLNTWWWGGVLMPQPLITAVRQYFSLKMDIPLDNLSLELDFISPTTSESIIVGDLLLEGAKWNQTNMKLELTDCDVSTRLPPCQLIPSNNNNNSSSSQTRKSIPLYWSKDRLNTISSFNIETIATDKELQQRGVALILWH